MTWALRRTAISSSNMPVSLTDVKEHLNIALSDTSQDDKITSLIIAATERIERDIDRITISGTFVADGPSFENPMILNIKPVTAVNQITYIDTDGVSQTLDPSLWRYVASSQKIVPAVNTEFPSVYAGLPDAVNIAFSAGYGLDAECQPRLIQAAIKLTVGKYFYDPAQESSALHSSESAYRHIVNNLMRSSYP